MCEKCLQYVLFWQCKVKLCTELQVVITGNFCREESFITKTNVHLPCFYIRTLYYCLHVDDVFG